MELSLKEMLFNKTSYVGMCDLSCEELIVNLMQYIWKLKTRSLA